MIDLSKVPDTVMHTGHTADHLFYRGQHVYNANPLAPFYGAGPGQIATDWRLHSRAAMSVDADGRVSAVRNAGAAGQYFDLLAAGTKRPKAADGGLVFEGQQSLAVANTASLDGVHLLVAGQFSSTAKSKLFGSQSPAGPFVYASWDSKITFAAVCQQTGSGLNSGRNGGYNMANWNIFEMRYANGQLQFFLQGRALTAASAMNFPNGFPLKYLGDEVGYSDLNYKPFVGTIGRAVGVICDPAHSALSPEPAVLATRQWLAAKYGVALQ